MRQGRQNSVMEHLQENFAMYILVTIIFTLGITGGAFSVRLLTDVQIKELNQVFFNFLDYMTLEEPLNQSLILQRSLLQNGVFLLLLWLSGNFFFGSIIGLGCVFYRGFSIGFTVGFLAQQNALQGILFSLGAILPQNLIYVPTTIVAGVFAVTSSLAIFRSRFQSKSLPAGGPFFMQYVILILLLGVCLAVGSLVESMITPVFMRVIISIL